MSALKAVGGILALAGGVLVVLLVLDMMIGLGIFTSMYMMTYAVLVMVYGELFIYINLVIAILAVVGGILALAGKKAGGALALIAGIVWLIGGFANLAMIFPVSAIYAWTGQLVIGGFLLSIEGILALVGGILALSGGSD
ncbi:MAG TPA: hypothetical protein VMV49_15460 [Candidatus Deferrimicrobium sp.]|nr:hypothetical protein [Candidatus Deferrimicrobium sp.]